MPPSNWGWYRAYSILGQRTAWHREHACVCGCRPALVSAQAAPREQPQR